MSEFGPIILGIAHGLKDSLIGMTALLRLKSILGENQTERQHKTDTHSFRRTRNRTRQTEKKTDRYKSLGLIVHILQNLVII